MLSIHAIQSRSIQPGPDGDYEQALGATRSSLDRLEEDSRR